ncbi:MAG: hypothetical protein K8U03_24795 [Planctomycetia bacterium]|nr:hypothetical protein [Planctomycetia bacterium]
MTSILRLLLLSVSVFVATSPAAADEKNVAQEEAIAAIRKMKGNVKIDDKRPGKPVTEVHLFGGKTKGIGLAPLTKLPEVEWIGLHLSDITEDDLEYLKPLKLRRVGLADIKLTDSGLARIEGITSIETLYLMENPITDAGLVHLRGMTKLKLLAIGTSKITDAGVVHLAPLQNLEELRLDRTAVTDAGLKHLTSFTKLQRLNLEGLRGVRDLAPLAECKSLVSLSVRGTKVDAAQVASLQKALPNCKIEWDAPKDAPQPTTAKPKP